MVSAPKTPPPPAPPPPPPTPPTYADASVALSGQAQKMQAAAASGRGFDGTLLTGPSGSKAPEIAKATLGGG